MRIDAARALQLEGVIAVLTHENRPDVPAYGESDDAPSFAPLKDTEVHFSAQPVALVVAETSELAGYAASLVRIEYSEAVHVTELRTVRSDAYDPKEGKESSSSRDFGDARAAVVKPPVRHEAEYTHPFEHHNPMEMHATTVERHGDGTLRVVLTRQQMFSIGYRPWSIQRLALGADKDGALQAIVHDALTNTSRLDDYTENDVGWSAALYPCPDIARTYKVAQTDWYTPTDMRAPGGTTGVWAIESAMDEARVLRSHRRCACSHRA